MRLGAMNTRGDGFCYSEREEDPGKVEDAAAILFKKKSSEASLCWQIPQSGGRDKTELPHLKASLSLQTRGLLRTVARRHRNRWRERTEKGGGQGNI